MPSETTSNQPPGEEEKESNVDNKPISEVSPQEIASRLSDAPKEFVEKMLPLMQEMVGLVQLATAGDVEKVDDLLTRPGNFMQRLMSIDQMALMGFLEARGLWYLLQPVADGEKITHRIKIEWAKLIVELIKYNENKRLSRENDFRPLEGRASGEVARYSNELLQELDGDGKKTRPPGSG
jgi:hypothetical protein